MKFLLDIDVVLKSQFNFLFSLKNFLILILEKNGTEVIELGHDSYEIFMFFQFKIFEKRWNNSVITIKKLAFSCRIERET